jgi:hypothetical protein
MINYSYRAYLQRVIQSSSRVHKDVVRKTIWNWRKSISFGFATVLGSRIFRVYVAFIIVVESYKMETIRFNIKVSCYSYCNEINEILSFVAIPVLVVGTCLLTVCTVHNHNGCLKCPPSAWIHSSQWRQIDPLNASTFKRPNSETFWNLKKVICIFCSKLYLQQPPEVLYESFECPLYLCVFVYVYKYVNCKENFQ